MLTYRFQIIAVQLLMPQIQFMARRLHFTGPTGRFPAPIGRFPRSSADRRRIEHASTVACGFRPFFHRFSTVFHRFYRFSSNDNSGS